MTGPALNEKQVACIEAEWNELSIYHKRDYAMRLISDWRTLRAALDEQVKENEQFVEQIGMLRKDAVHAEMQQLLIAHNETLDCLARAEAALASRPDTALEALVEVSDALGHWMSAALDDACVCAEMKADIQKWFAVLARPDVIAARKGGTP